MTPIYQVRIATRADLAFLHEIERAASTLFPEGRLPDPDDVMPMRDLEEASDHHLVLVAALEGEIVGFAMSRAHEDRLHLAVVAVHPDHGRRGVGARLVRAVVAQAASRGLSGVTLTTFRDLPWNAPFYAKLGFRVLDEAELNPMLHATLAQEARLGMTDRVAMLYACDP
jgi:ribosomal protein S18 acetylase RimI-like enzyme